MDGLRVALPWGRSTPGVVNVVGSQHQCLCSPTTNPCLAAIAHLEKKDMASVDLFRKCWLSTLTHPCDRSKEAPTGSRMTWIIAACVLLNNILQFGCINSSGNKINGKIFFFTLPQPHWQTQGSTPGGSRNSLSRKKLWQNVDHPNYKPRGALGSH